jgi:hypothetical protein
MIGILIVFVFASVAPSFATAVQVGDIVRLNLSAAHSPGFNGGGFDVYKNGTRLFTTFCLEANEYFNPGSNYYVSDISLNAFNGGVGGGHPDPVSVQTQFLYYHFIQGDLIGFSGSGSDQKYLQQTFWYFENEIALTGVHDQKFVTLANNYVNSGGSEINSVRVMNIVDPGNHSIHKQSQLIYVPEPATLILFCSGLLGLALAGRNKFRK